MPKLLLLLTCLALYCSTYAQTATLYGKVVDGQKAHVVLANITLVNTANRGAAAASTLTDSLGSFALAAPAAGTYVVQVTAIGFAKKETDPVAVTGGASIALGTITVQRESKELQNVDILSMRPTITQLADRMVINVQGTAMAAGNNAFQLLSKSPGVFVDPEGSIQLNGRGGVTVMIDGRLTYLSARDLRNLLESTPAENIKSIELITNPSAKYDAEGTSGIVNIVFKKNVLQGVNGSVYSSYSTNFKQHFYGAGTTVNYKSGRWNAFLVSDFNRRGGGREATFTRVFRTPQRTTYFDQTAIGNWSNIGPPSIRVGTDFTINQNHSVGIIGSYFTNTAEAEFLTETYIGDAPRSPSQYIDADNFNSNTIRNGIVNLHYTGKLDTAGTTLSADFDLAGVRNKGDGNFFNRFLRLADGQQTTDNLYTYTPNGFDIYSGKIDFSHPLTKTQKLEAGGRVSRVESDNDFRFYFNNNGKVPDPQRTNYFRYTESIYAAYLNWSGSLGKNTTLQAGLRAEQTHSKGESFTTGEVTERDYLNLFPSVFLQHKYSDNYNVAASYSRRLNRPNYGNLNPFRYYRDPYTWTVGNPYLRPQYTDLFNLNQTIKKLYVVQLFYQYTKDVMTELPIPDAANAVTVYTTGNVDDAYSGGLSAIIPVKLAKKWDTRNTAQLSYSKFTTFQGTEQLVNEQLFYYVQSAHTVLLPKAFRVEATFLYRGPAASGLYQQKALHRIDLAFNKSFAKKKWELALNITDLTKGWRYRWAANYGGNINEFDQYMRWRTLGLTLRYNFSKGLKAELKQRSGPDELNRL
ncbi:Outer membrane receptor proteins, mostly Fe transport [Cnuella takakiae]|uniref:Outer membrane receptor proteins, mostly Fe transport n=1 Tax=Cnuella takakiae TaxID=1302690 RepID=A0A1M4T6B7_9BACT|nr:TonB-dependent receptor [Cnuella takakiae]OLY90682.1 TonB-dependent receptor [Cnuella takakiae]SHE39960.1 Outer membrane receptor proteins, mostly Fe transport [Cnuella takakiae]